MDWAGYIATALAAYLLGSIPFGFLMGKAKGIDLRQVGSGNIGATNALRILGRPAGIAVLVLDGLKGYAGVAWLVPLLMSGLALDPGQREPLMVVAGVCAVLGHNYTCWLYFKGGKVKLSIALAKGKRRHDKREAIKRRDEKRDLDRARKQYM